MALHLLYGGTFDPPHLGHLAVARAALAATGACRLDLLPCADPAHRQPPGASAAERALLVRAAIAGESGLGIDLRELHRPGPSYTVDSLRQWRAEHGDTAPLGFVLGADAFLALPAWKDWQELPTLAHLVVAVRPGLALDELPPALARRLEGARCLDPALLHRAAAGSWFPLDLPLRQESSTALRAALAAGDRHPAGLPETVARAIAGLGLYPVRD